MPFLLLLVGEREREREREGLIWRNFQVLLCETGERDATDNKRPLRFFFFFKAWNIVAL